MWILSDLKKGTSQGLGVSSNEEISEEYQNCNKPRLGRQATPNQAKLTQINWRQNQ